MKATIPELDVLHEVFFATPAFALARSAPDVLKVFYEVISPRYQIHAEHISVIASNIFSELVIRLGLFQNAVALEIRPAKMLLFFPNSRNKESVQVIKHVVTLVHDAQKKRFRMLLLEIRASCCNVHIMRHVASSQVWGA